MRVDDLDFPGVSIRKDEGAILLSSVLPLRVLSSAVVGGGAGVARHIINLHVAKGYCSEGPERDLAAAAAARGVEGPFVGLMTAASLDRARGGVDREGGLAALAIMTLGLTNPTAAGLSRPELLTVGTINTIAVVDGNLADAAMVNAVMTMTEAKTLALAEEGVKTREGGWATGTSTDAVVLACTGQGAFCRYAGPATDVGWLLGRMVYKLTRETTALWKSSR